MAQTQPLCEGLYGFQEQGKAVRLLPRQGEQCWAVVLDDCVVTDDEPRCDGVFLWRGKAGSMAILVELKGAGDIPRAYEQLAYVRKHREEYRALKERFEDASTGVVREKAFIVSNGQLSRPEQERLERQHGIRVSAVLHSEPTTPIPDLRQELL